MDSLTGKDTEIKLFKALYINWKAEWRNWKNTAVYSHRIAGIPEYAEHDDTYTKYVPSDCGQTSRAAIPYRGVSSLREMGEGQNSISHCHGLPQQKYGKILLSDLHNHVEFINSFSELQAFV